MYPLCTALMIIISFNSNSAFTRKYQSGANNNTELINEGRSLLPPIFRIDNYDSCKLENKLYCNVVVKLFPLNENLKSNTTWEIIQELDELKHFYYHDELFHAICVENFCPETNFTNNMNETILLEKLSECYSNKYRNLSLSATVTKITFTREHNFPIKFMDIIILLIFTLYIAYFLYANLYDFSNKFSNPPTNNEKTWILPFCLRHNWKRLNRVNKSEDSQKFKAVEGIRFYNMVLVLSAHTYVSYLNSFVSNTDYFEDMWLNSYKMFLVNVFAFVVQTYFIFSAFFVSYHNFKLMEQQTEFKISSMVLQFLNRYLRLFPVLVAITGPWATVWVPNYFIRGPLSEIYLDEEYNLCRKNWWITLLFFNNHYKFSEMCNTITWYVSADTQLYAIALIILSIIWKFKHLTERILSFFIIFAIAVHSVALYTYSTDVIYDFSPRHVSNHKNMLTEEFSAIYASTYSSMATYVIGLGFGYFHYKAKHKDIKKSLITNLLYYSMFAAMPILIVLATCFQYSRSVTIILGCILKPLFGFGIGVGIFGMSHSFGGIIKTICEWKFAVFMGTFTYSTYLSHTAVVFNRVQMITEPIHVTDELIVTSFIYDLILSYIAGFGMYMLVEAPFVQLQNKFIPKKWGDLSKNDQNCIPSAKKSKCT